MDNPNEMWELFLDKIRTTQANYIPTKMLEGKKRIWPEWMDRKTMKLVRKQRRTWLKYRKTGDSFFLNKYKHERRECRGECRKQKKNYIVNRICNPLKKGNSKPFYKHLQQIKGKSQFGVRLKTDSGEPTDDPILCAETLNRYFHCQFGSDQLTGLEQKLEVVTESIEVTSDGIEKLIHNLKNGKSPGPDGLR